MKIIKPSVEFLWSTPNPLQEIEKAGRTCYKSEDKITDGSAEKFVKMLVSRGHTAMIEHASISYKVIFDRGVTHEIVRHRIFSFAQESTRYVNYKGTDMQFIRPCFWKDGDYCYSNWYHGCHHSEKLYNEMIKDGASPQEARSVLPNSLKTEIVITGNLREWLHFFKLRCAPAAHPQMREVAHMMLEDIQKRIPVVFDEV